MFQLTLVVPTYNEKNNIKPLVTALNNALQDINWEVVFVDDNSTDGTLAILRQLAIEHDNIRFIHRLHERGLASACIEGMLSSTSPYLAVMDADLQHDERILPDMLKKLEEEGFDIAIGSRHTSGGSMGSMPAYRQKISRLAGKLSRLILKQPVSDPMSGYFMIKRRILDHAAGQLTTTGYKLLLDILLCSPKGTAVTEVAYDMRHRQHGESKLEAFVALEYLWFLLDKSIGRFIPVRFILFTLVGSFGVLVHMSALATLHLGFSADFFISQTSATLIAMTSNFMLNNMITYRDKRLKGIKLITGLLNFYLACSLGAVINLMVADFLKTNDYLWWSAGIMGAFVGAVWNYAMTSVFTWKSNRD